MNSVGLWGQLQFIYCATPLKEMTEKFCDVAKEGFEIAKEKAVESKEKYNMSYDEYSECYANMSDDELKEEIELLKRGIKGDACSRNGRIQAMKDEIENRRK